MKFNPDDPQQEKTLALIDEVLIRLREKGATDAEIIVFGAMIINEKAKKGELLPFTKEMFMEGLIDLLQRDKLK